MEALQCCKQITLHDPCQNSEDRNVGRNAENKIQVQKILVGNKASTGNCTKVKKFVYSFPMSSSIKENKD